MPNQYITMKEKEYSNELDNITVSFSHNTHNPYLTLTNLGRILNRIKEDSELERIVDVFGLFHFKEIFWKGNSLPFNYYKIGNK